MKPNSFWKYSIQDNSRSSYLDNKLKYKPILDLSSGENVFFEYKNITKILKKIKLLDLQEAPDIKCDNVKKKIAEMLHIQPNMISVGNGSDEIIENISRVFLEPHDRAFTIVPTFFRFTDSIKRMKGKIITVKTTENKSFHFTDKVIQKTISAIKKHNPKIVWLCSPNNPTGEVMKLEQIQRVLEVSQNLVIVDEAFQELIDPENRKSAITLIEKYKNLLVLKTFSKTWGLGGVRFGFVVSSEAIINTLEKWRLPFNVNTVTRKIILELLDHWDDLKMISKDTKIRKEFLFNEIKKLPHLEIGADSKTNIFILRHKTKDLFQELLKRRILTADFRQANGLEGKGYVRITIKTRKENGILLKVLREIG